MVSVKNLRNGAKLKVEVGCWVGGLDKASGGAVGRDML